MQKITHSYLKAHPLPDHRSGDKQARGRVLIIGGSVEIPGAALLASLGALRAGAGVLQIATCESAAGALRMSVPEAMVVGCRETPAGGIHPSSAERLAELARDCDAVLVGPGMVDSEAVAALSRALLEKVARPLFVLDAEAFVQMRTYPELLAVHGKRIVGTPHAGEMSKFLNVSRGEVERKAPIIVQQVSKNTGAIIVLKGSVTYVAGPSGDAWLCDHGCIGLGTSGSGDTLAGIVTGLLARGTEPSRAACWGVYLHAEAGQRLTTKFGSVGFLAREIPDQIPGVMADLA